MGGRSSCPLSSTDPCDNVGGRRQSDPPRRSSGLTDYRPAGFPAQAGSAPRKARTSRQRSGTPSSIAWPLTVSWRSWAWFMTAWRSRGLPAGCSARQAPENRAQAVRTVRTRVCPRWTNTRASPKKLWLNHVDQQAISLQYMPCKHEVEPSVMQSPSVEKLPEHLALLCALNASKGRNYRRSGREGRFCFRLGVCGSTSSMAYTGRRASDPSPCRPPTAHNTVIPAPEASPGYRPSSSRTARTKNGLRSPSEARAAWCQAVMRAAA